MRPRLVKNIKDRILAGEATVDPNGFLRRDPGNREAITMDEIMVIGAGDEQKILRVHQSFVRPHLRVYEMQPLSPEDAERLDQAFRINLEPGVPAKKESATPVNEAPARVEAKAPREKPVATEKKTPAPQPAQF